MIGNAWQQMQQLMLLLLQRICGTSSSTLGERKSALKLVGELLEKLLDELFEEAARSFDQALAFSTGL